MLVTVSSGASGLLLPWQLVLKPALVPDSAYGSVLASGNRDGARPRPVELRSDDERRSRRCGRRLAVRRRTYPPYRARSGVSRLRCSSARWSATHRPIGRRSASRRRRCCCAISIPLRARSTPRATARTTRTNRNSSRRHSTTSQRQGVEQVGHASITRSRRLFARALRCAPRRRRQPGSRVQVGRRVAALHPPRVRRAARRRRRQHVHRLRDVVGAADPRPRAARPGQGARRGGARRHELRRAEPARGRARRARARG